jgi:Meiotically up-regulated gene 113
MLVVIDKSFIIEEIRRTAEENGGKALGAARFEKETGLKRSDWEGVFWARWGDALLDSGLSPNQFQMAIETDTLVRLFAELAKELGHLPVKAELKMAHRRQPDFPSDPVFQRLGSKEKLIQLVAEWSREHSGFEDVVRWCDDYLEHAPKRKNSIAKHAADEPELGQVYLMKSGRYFKIGKTCSTGRREYEVGLQLPDKVETIHAFETDDPHGIEAYWHKRFAAKRKNGEWFDLSREDVAAFKRRRKFM